MKVLAIDPGSVCAGFAVMALEGRRMTYLTSGILRFSPKDEFLDRIKFIYSRSLDLLLEYKPTDIALESLIYVKSPTSLMKLAQARGAMLAALTQTGCSIHEYAPTAIKAAVAGHGGADKESLQKLIKMHVGPVEFETHDESDAVAIAICHLLHRNSVFFEAGKSGTAKRKGAGLAAALQHKLKGVDI